MPSTKPLPAPTRPRVAPHVDPDPGLDERPDPSAGDGDHDRFAHYVRKRDLERARRKGGTVRALCGKRWKPVGDPSKYPMCPTCAEVVAESISRGLGG